MPNWTLGTAYEAAIALQVGCQRKPGLEVQRSLGTTAIQVLAIPERRQTRVQAKIGIVPSYLSHGTILRNRHACKEQSNSKNEHTSDLHVNLLAC
jgi:hypothetical protein